MSNRPGSRMTGRGRAAAEISCSDIPATARATTRRAHQRRTLDRSVRPSPSDNHGRQEQQRLQQVRQHRGL